jgi:hypothetical protein
MEPSLRYRVTGPQSIERITPLLEQLKYPCTWIEADDSTSQIDFVWETSCSLKWNERHAKAKVVNRLHNIQVLEDKTCLAYLQLNMRVPTLQTFVAANKAILFHWLRLTYAPRENGDGSGNGIGSGRDFCTVPGDSWWAIKASKGNGGKDVWIVNPSNYEDIMNEIQTDEEYVIQKYIMNPSLWNGRKKFHYRCYTTLCGDMSSFLYTMSYLLTASTDYDAADADTTKHITNLSVNKHSPGHPGQVPFNIQIQCPKVFAQISDVWCAAVEASSPFLHRQRSKEHFEFFGIDIITDDCGGCWLIEANRRPGIESSSNNKVAEDEMYDKMMLSLIRSTTRTLHDSSSSSEITSADEHIFHNLAGTMKNGTEVPLLDSRETSPKPNEELDSALDGVWVRVKESDPRMVIGEDAPMWLNLMNWRAYTKKNSSKVMIPSQ